MDKIGPVDPASLLSRQVTGAQYFFLHLAPRARGPAALVLGGREHCAPDYRIDRGRFPYHVIEYVRSGAGRVSLDGREYPLGPGSVFSYAPTTRCAIATDPRQPLVKYFLCLAGSAIPARLRAAGIPLGRCRRLAGHAEVTSVVEDLVREGQRATPVAGRICQARLALLLLKVEEAGRLPAAAAPDPAREGFLRCKALIDAEAERLRSLAQVAAAAGVEASSVCRWFRRFQGTSPYQYLLRRKMNVAARLLVEGGGLVKEVAQRVGFEDPYHFSRAFKSVHGVAPRLLLARRTGG